MGTGLGVAVFGSVLAGVYTAQLALPAGLDAAQTGAAETLGGALDVADGLPAGAADALAASARAAFAAATDTSAAVGLVVMLAAAALVAAVWRTPRS